MKTIICDMSGVVSIKGINNIELLQAFKDLKRTKYTFCTGKGFLGAVDTICSLEVEYPIICENGALLIDTNGKKTYSSVIEYDKIKYIIDILSKKTEYEFISCCNLKTNKYKFLYNEARATEGLKPNIFFNEETFYDANDYLKALKNIEVVRVIYRGKEISSEVLNKINGFFEISCSEKEYYNFCNVGINKRKGIEIFAKHFNISNSNIVLIGNDYNDIEMFKFEAAFKIAVGNDCPKALLELANINVKIEDLPKILVEIDKDVTFKTKCPLF